MLSTTQKEFLFKQKVLKEYKEIHKPKCLRFKTRFSYTSRISIKKDLFYYEEHFPEYKYNLPWTKSGWHESFLCYIEPLDIIQWYDCGHLVKTWSSSKYFKPISNDTPDPKYIEIQP